ncbi:hypothetical protein [Cellulomonas sp.]|uniref:hypothetical protein n=1 Tax=Cellulomonas sp. TaxID=40001 RepID=UPI003BA972BC
MGTDDNRAQWRSGEPVDPETLAALREFDERHRGADVPDPAAAIARIAEESRWAGLESRTLWEPLPGAPEWAVGVRWVVDGDALVPSAITLTAPAGEAVTAVALRRVKVGDVIGRTRARARIALLGEAWQAERRGEAVGFDAQAVGEAAVRQPKRRGGAPRTYDDDHYRRVAAIYDAARSPERGKAPEPPVRAVAKAFGLSETEMAKAKGWVARARALGFLQQGATTKGGRDDG